MSFELNKENLFDLPYSLMCMKKKLIVRFKNMNSIVETTEKNSKYIFKSPKPKPMNVKEIKSKRDLTFYVKH